VEKESLKQAVANTKLEGIDLLDNVLEIIEKALEKNESDKSFLYEINKLLESKKDGKSK